MSDMLNEKWRANGDRVLTWDGALCADTADDEFLARAIAVLPEALALLKELEATPGGVDGGRERARDLLERAGVLE